MIVMIFIIGLLIGVLGGGALCVRYLRQEIAANIGPRLRRVLSFAMSMGPGCCHDLGTTLRLLDYLGAADRVRQTAGIAGRCRRR